MNAMIAGRVAIIDIGSNSVRLVVLDGLSRAPRELFTEQMYPHLGRRIAKTRLLDPEGVETCLDGLARYARLCDALDVRTRIVVATAAVREAEDGADFVRAVKSRTGLDVEIIGGKEEGRLSALGVISGMPSAHGLVGDLGGGSLELALVGDGKVGQRVTLPLGPFRLQQSGHYRAGREKLVAAIDRELRAVPWISEAHGQDFYAVGGNWRAIAKVQIRRDQYPLDLVHQHKLTFRQGIEVAEFLSTLTPSSLAHYSVPKKRSELVPYAALVMERTLRFAKPKKLVFSGHGLRDGLVFDRLDDVERTKDPLLATCESAGGNSGYGRVVFSWAAPLFNHETKEERRLRHAVSLLSEIGAEDNPVHRAESAYMRTLYLPSGGLDHHGRAFLACALYRRYDGSIETKAGKAIRSALEQLISPGELRAAERIGAVLNFAGALSCGVGELLDSVELTVMDSRLILGYDVRDSALLTEAMIKRFESLAKSLHLRPVLGRPEGS